MATTEPRNELPNSSTSTPSKIEMKKCAPMAARMRRNVFEKPADLMVRKSAFAGEDRLRYTTALLIRAHQMLALQERGAGPAPFPRRSGQLDQGLDLRVVLGADGLHSIGQMRNPA